MSRQKPNTIHLDSWDWERAHREKVIAKVEKIEGIKALLQEWEQSPDADYAYILKLRAKLRSAESQLAAMSL